MRAHVRANLCLLGFTVILCAVLYPLTLLGIGQTVFPDRAGGSLLKDEDGKVIGSRLIAQNFTSKEYFWPRPSAASYNAAASGASNWSASNPLLRNRVARQLGPIVRYDQGAERYGKKPSDLVGKDVEEWFRANEGIVSRWLELNSIVAEAWVKDTGDALKEQTGKDTPGAAFAAQWQKDFPERYARWRADNPDKEPAPGDLTRPFFEGFIVDRPGLWPVLEDVKVGDRTLKKIGGTREGEEIQATFFDLWRHQHDKVPLEPVPADMVMASASGLDPHITLDNARYQARHRIAAAWAEKIGKEKKIELSQEQRERITARIMQLLDEHASAPLWGLAGVPLVNVLEVNLALIKQMSEVAESIK
jgi:K+-transporting ATPase ATPase C chain